MGSSFPPLVAVIVGIRSQYIKLAALQRRLDAATEFECRYVDTGQHYDAVLAEQYHKEYELHFDAELRCGGPENSPAETLARMLVGTDELLTRWRPSAVLVFGDANSTFVGALSARRHGIPVAHLEAGVRTGADTPEELNRVLVDRMATLHMASTLRDFEQLRAEGYDRSSVFTGDVVRDLCTVTTSADLGVEYGLVTIHRAENTVDSSVVRSAIGALESSGLRPVVIFHPRVLRLIKAESPELLERVVPLESLPHARLLSLVKGSAVVLTDSGALQRESFYLDRRAVVVQDSPFWPSLIDAGFHIGVAPTGDLASAVRAALGPAPHGVDEFGQGGASQRAVEILGEWVGAL